jgi:hypothetical protein
MKYTHEDAIREITEISNTKILKNNNNKSQIGFEKCTNYEN